MQIGDEQTGTVSANCRLQLGEERGPPRRIEARLIDRRDQLRKLGRSTRHAKSASKLMFKTVYGMAYMIARLFAASRAVTASLRSMFPRPLEFRTRVPGRSEER